MKNGKPFFNGKREDLDERFIGVGAKQVIYFARVAHFNFDNPSGSVRVFVY